MNNHRFSARMPLPDAHILVARASGGGALSSTTVIIIAVSCSVGGLVLGFVMWRILRACRSTSAPLPPVQPLARHREEYPQHSDKSRISVWNAERGGNRLQVFPSDQASDDPLFSSRHASFQTDDSEPMVSSPVLPYPNPAFKASWGGRDSSPLGSMNSTSTVESIPLPQGASSHSLPHAQSMPSDMNSATASSSRPIPRQARPSLPRPVSSASYNSATNRNTIRGSPHGPHSNIQIVLPSPLSPQLHPDSRGGSRMGNREDMGSRNSYVDQWISPNGFGPEHDGDEPAHSMQIPPFTSASNSLGPLQRS